MREAIGADLLDVVEVVGGRRVRVEGPPQDPDEEVLVSTKGGVAWELEPEFRIWRAADRDYLRMALERSLAALERDYVDIYHVHWPVASVPVAETIAALVELRDEGKIRAIAVSNYHLDDLRDKYLPGLAKASNE